MPQITGRVYDIGLSGSKGKMWLSAGFRTGTDGVVAPRRVSYPIVDGELPDNIIVEPGPAYLEIDVGMDAHNGWPVNIPETDVSLKDLISEVYDWSPTELSLFAQMRIAAEDAAQEAETLAGEAGTAKGAAEDAAAAAALDRVHVDSIRALLDEAAENNVAPYLTPTALNATYGTKAEVAERATAPTLLSSDGQKATGLAAAIAAAVGEVTLPTGTPQAITTTLTIDKEGFALRGSNPVRARIDAGTMTGPMIALAPTSAFRSALRLSDLRLAGAKADAVHIGHVKDSQLTRVWVSGAAGSGIKTGLGGHPSWNVLYSECTSTSNTLDGIDLSTNTANVALRDFNAIYNLRHGINAGKICVIDHATLDGNGVANINIEGVHQVTVRDSYFEPKGAVYNPADPKYHVRVKDSSDVVLTGRILQVIPGTAIHLENARDVLLDELGSDVPATLGVEWDQAWSSRNALAIYITASCRRIRLRHFPHVPIFFEDRASLDLSHRRKLASTVDVLGGDGLFTTGSDGLGAGWLKASFGALPTTSFVAAKSAPNPQAQRVESTADWSGIRHPVTLEANTEYTAIMFIENTGDVRFGSAASLQLGGGGANNVRPMARMRMVCIPFDSGSTPPTHVGLWLASASRVFTVEGFRVLKGRFTPATVPLD